METLNLIGSICSIASLIITLILTNQVVSIKKKIKDNSRNNPEQKEINTGGGDFAGRDMQK